MGVCKKEEKGLKRTKPRGESKARERLTGDESRPGQAEETRDGTNLVHQAKQITRASNAFASTLFAQQHVNAISDS